MRDLKIATFCLGACFLLSCWLGIQAALHVPVAGCGMDAGCGTVLASSWARLGPVPVVWVGAFVYAVECAVVLAALAGTSRIGGLVRLMPLLLGANAAAAVFFTGVQIWGVQRWCPWCCTIHVLACFGAGFASRGLARTVGHTGADEPSRPVMPHQLVWAAAAQIVVLAALTALLPSAYAQQKTAPAAVDAPSAERSDENPAVLQLHDGRFRFDLTGTPLLGEPEAEHVVVVITDPTCPHCRFSARLLWQSWAALPTGKAAVLCLPGTRDPVLGPALQTLLLTLWKEQPEAWKRIIQDLDGETLDPHVETVREAVAKELGGREALDVAVREHQEWSAALIRQTSELMRTNADLAGKEVALPQIQSHGQLIFGALSGASDLNLLTRGELEWPETAPVDLRHWKDSNPCANRKFCQRLVLIIVGKGKEELVPGPLKLDRFGHSALDDVKLLSKSRRNQNPPMTYLFSGTEELSNAVRGLKLAHVKVFDSTHDDWNAFIDKLPKELEALLKNTRCAPLVKERLKEDMPLHEKLAELSKFLSVEVSVYGHSTKLPRIRAKDQTHGVSFGESVEKTSPFRPSNHGVSSIDFDEGDFLPLRRLLKNAMFRGLTQACNGTEVIKFLKPVNDDECACFVSGSGATTLTMSWEGKSPLGLLKLEAKGGGATLAGVRDMLYAPLLYTPFREQPDTLIPGGLNAKISDNRRNYDLRYGDSIFALHDTVDYMSLPKNPLVGLVVSSADLAAEDALETLSKSNDETGEMARQLLSITSRYQADQWIQRISDPADRSVFSEILVKADRKAAQLASPRQITAKTAKENYDYGIHRLNRLFSPNANLDELNEEERKFVQSVEAVKERHSTDELPSRQVEKFHELFDPDSENWIGRLNQPSTETDEKLRLYWGRIDYMRQLLSVHYRNERRLGNLGQEDYENLMDTLQTFLDDFNPCMISAYIGSRAHELRKGAAVVSELKIEGALALLARRIDTMDSTDGSGADLELVNAWRALRVQILCLEGYRYGPDTFTANGDTFFADPFESGTEPAQNKR